VLLDGHVPAQRSLRELVAVCFVGDLAAMAGENATLAGSHDEIVREVARMEAGRHPRWVFWSAQADATRLVIRGIHLDRCWDIAEAHRILVGGRGGDPAMAWATVCRLVTTDLPRAAGGDLFDFAAEHDPGDRGDPESPVRSDGYLRPEAACGTWQNSTARVLAWAGAALDTATRQIAALSQISSRAVSTGQSESAAALLCVELATTGLPVDRPTIEALIEDCAGPRPAAGRVTPRCYATPPGASPLTCETRCRSRTFWHRSALWSPTRALGDLLRFAAPIHWWRRC
jgi:DNA polymerase-1